MWLYYVIYFKIIIGSLNYFGINLDGVNCVYLDVKNDYDI